MSSASPQNTAKERLAIAASKQRRRPVRYDQFQQVNPHRPLAWRWQRAQTLIEQDRQALGSRDDEMTRRAVRYLRDWRRAVGGEQLDRVAARHRDIHLAAMVYEEDDSTRWLLESRILARLSSETIAALSCLPAGTVSVYESLFFAVRDRLHANDFIMLQTMPTVVRGEVTEHDTATILKLLAYFGGPFVLETLARHLLAPPLLAQLSDSHASTLDRIRRLVEVLNLKQIDVQGNEESAEPRGAEDAFLELMKALEDTKELSDVAATPCVTANIDIDLPVEQTPEHVSQGLLAID